MASEPVIQCLDDIQETRMQWLWPSRIPLGALTLIAGDPGASKSTLSIDIAARISTGAPFPDGSGGGAPASAIMVGAEDDIAATVKPRLRVAGADMRRIFTLDGIRVGADGRSSMFQLHHAPHLEEQVVSLGVKMVVIDPIASFWGRVRANDAPEVSTALVPLQELATRTGVAIVLIAHLNKSSVGVKAMYRPSGSIALIGRARAAWMVSADPQDPELRCFAKLKLNVARDPGTLAYRIEDVEGVPRVVWQEGVHDVTADELLDGTNQRGSSDISANVHEAWLRAQLAAGDRPVRELQEDAKRAGIGWRLMEQAKKRLGVENHWQGRMSVWRLPDTTAFGRGVAR